MLTKGEIVTQALKRIRISGLTSDADPREIVDAIQELDLMIGAWRDRGLDIPYDDTPDFSDPNTNQLSGIIEENNQAVVLNLALNLCDLFGKSPTQTLKQMANATYSSLFSIVMPSRDGNPYLPMGRGSSYPYSYSFDYNKFFTTEKSAPIDSDTEKLAIGDTYDYTVSWDDWLAEGAAIESYTIKSTNGITLVEHQLQGNEVYFKVTGAIAGVSVIDIKVASTLEDRVDNRAVYFNVVERKS
jgi:hypothetical protein